MAPSAVERIRQYGWTGVSFGLSEQACAEYARISNGVIGLAQADERVRRALSFDIAPEQVKGGIAPGLFGISGARNSLDKKIWLHGGYQTESRVSAQMPLNDQPQILRDYWPALTKMLKAVEMSMRGVLCEIGAEPVAAIIFPRKLWKRNVHIRTVRYLGARQSPAWSEVVAGHADLGLCSEHIFETHGNWFYGGRYYGPRITDDQSDERKAAIRALRQELRRLDTTSEEALFFLGAGWHGLPDGVLTDDARCLPALYHAGFRPDSGQEYVSSYAEVVTGNPEDRVSVIAFAQPNLDFATNGEFVLPTVAKCRPQY